MYPEAVAEAQKTQELSTVITHSFAFEIYALAISGKRGEAHAKLNELLQLTTSRFVPPYNIALAYNGLGDTGKTYEWLEIGYEQGDPRLVFLKSVPKWNNLRDEPRFIDLTSLNP